MRYRRRGLTLEPLSFRARLITGFIGIAAITLMICLLLLGLTTTYSFQIYGTTRCFAHIFSATDMPRTRRCLRAATLIGEYASHYGIAYVAPIASCFDCSSFSRYANSMPIIGLLHGDYGHYFLDDTNVSRKFLSILKFPMFTLLFHATLYAFDVE